MEGHLSGGYYRIEIESKQMLMQQPLDQASKKSSQMSSMNQHDIQSAELEIHKIKSF